jgi:hypothetical protein
VFIACTLLFPFPVIAWDDCPFGLEDDPYPGDCARYIDTDGDGICDRSQPAPEDREDVSSEPQGEEYIEYLETEVDEQDPGNVDEVPPSVDTAGSVSAVTTEHDTGTSRSSNPYNFVPVFLSVVILYGLMWYLTGTGPAKRNNFLSKPTFNLFWNTVLVLSAVPSVLFGFYLIFRYSIPALREVEFDFLYWHVEGSVVFGTTALMHLVSRLRQYVAPLRLFRRKM